MSKVIVNNKFNKEIDSYVIAEIGVNHGGSFDLAKRIIDEAVFGGADAVKFQSYKADKIASKDSPPYWDTSKERTKSQHELFKKFDAFDRSDYEKLKDYCDKVEVDFLSTPFDNDAADYLNPLMPFFKIASADLTNIPLLRKVGSFNKPILLSTGAASFWEIDMAIFELLNAGASDISLMHCILNYPTSYKDAELGSIDVLKKMYPDLIIGYSDHTFPEKDMLTVTTAFIKGAKIIEKHFTHDKAIIGNDHFHSMDKSDLIVLKENLKRVIEINKKTDFNNRPNERLAITHARRSIVMSCDMKKGERIEANCLTYKRPASGISTLHWDMVIGKILTKDVGKEHILKWDDVS